MPTKSREESCYHRPGRIHEGKAISMQESTLTVTPIESPTQPQTDDVSLVRAALFGAVVPPLLATTAFLLLRAGEWFALLSPFFFFVMFMQMSLFVSIFCAPFGMAFAILCGLLARTRLRRGDHLADVQTRMSSIGAMCGLIALWGVEILINGGRITLPMVNWPAPFWGAAVAVGGICGWLLPWGARSRRSVVTHRA